MNSTRISSVRGGKAAFVVNLHPKWNQMLSVGHVGNCGASADNTRSLIYTVAAFSFSSKSAKRKCKT